MVGESPAQRRRRVEQAKAELADGSVHRRRLTGQDVDRLLLSLSKTKGLSDDEKRAIRGRRWNVGEEFLPQRLKD